MKIFRLLVLAIFALFVATATVGATSPGNNGTTKIEDSVNPKPEPANDPHVCLFDIKFYNADAGQSGDWYIKSWPPTGDKTKVLWGTYSVNSDGFDRQPPIEEGYFKLPDGHYKLYWKGDESKHWKHKVFWVKCSSDEPDESCGTDLDEIGDNDIDNNPCPTETPEITPTPVPTETPEVTPTPTPSETPDVEPTETPVVTPTATPTATPIPRSNSTPPPTDTQAATVTDNSNLVAMVLFVIGMGVLFLLPKFRRNKTL